MLHPQRMFRLMCLLLSCMIGSSRQVRSVTLSKSRHFHQRMRSKAITSLDQVSILHQIRGGAGGAGPLFPNVDDFLETVDLLGTGVFAFSGAVAAGKKGMDLLGMIVIASVTAMGGGTLRDILLDRGVVFWMRHTIYLKISTITAIASYVMWPYLEKKLGWEDSALPICLADALGLAAFAVLGTQTAIDSGVQSPLIWVVSGLMSACFGGIVRDLICLQRPRVLFPERTLYATPPLLGSILYVTLIQQRRMDFTQQQVACASFLFTFFLRVCSFNTLLRLPHWHVSSSKLQ